MKPAPTSQPESACSDQEALSSVADGEGDAAILRRAVEAWRDDGELRATWHAYHLIGDVLRSDELAGAASRDAALLDAVRARLAAEPVVLAPAPRAAPHRSQRWLMPGAVAAGFVVVAGVVLVLEQQAAPAPTLAARDATAVAIKASAGPAASVPSLVTDGRVLRDARLDAYLDAHRGAVGGLPSALPGGGLRNVELLVPGR